MMPVGVMEMVVYLDVVVALNGLLDYLLLSVCGTVTASPVNRLRLLLAASVGGIYAGASLLPELSFLGNLFWQLVFGVLLFTGGASYALMKWGLSRLKHQGGDIAQLEILQGENRVRFTALRDTGNTLKDPISGCQVLVADWTLLRKLLPGTELRQEQFKEPAALMELLAKSAPRTAFRLIPYKAVGVEHGLLLAMRPEEVRINGKKESLLVGFSPVRVSDGGGYEALLGGVV